MAKLDEQNRIVLDQVARFCISIGQKQRELKDAIRNQQTTLDVILKQLRDHDGLIKVQIFNKKLDTNLMKTRFQMSLGTVLAGGNIDEVKDNLGIPWKKNIDMMECLEDERKRAQLVALSIDSKWQDSADAHRFIKMCFTVDHRVNIHSEE